MLGFIYVLWDQKLAFFSVLVTSALCAPESSLTAINLPQLDERIVGGKTVSIQDHPYQISLQLVGQHWCGGTIISNRYIVSAAHCFRYVTSLYNVRAGSSNHNSGGVVININTVSIHPEYNPRSHDNDIAIVYLASTLSFGDSIAPINLPSQDEEIAVGVDGIVTGWGSLIESRSGPIQLQAVTVPIISESTCQSSYDVYNFSVTKAMICAGYVEGGRDACQGDSGGPLVVNGQLIGVVSWGVGCAKPNVPGVYAKVAHLRYFIKQISGI